MKSAQKSAALIAVFAVMFCAATASYGAPLGTAFTYQGRLLDANDVADGLYDFKFRLYNAGSGGSQVGADVNIPNVDVIDGYFTAELDFGSVFDSNTVWLDTGVRPGALEDPNAYTSLNPRQKISPAPYALYALGGSLSWASLTGMPAGFADGVDDVGLTSVSWGDILGIPAGFADGVDDGLTIESDPTVAASVKDGVSWSEVSNRPVGLDDGDDVGLLAETDPQVGSNTVNYVPKWNGLALATGTIFDNGNIGIGTASPAQKLSVSGNASVSGDVYEGGTKLSDKYLGKTAMAANSDMLDSKHAADFVSSSLVGSSSVYEVDAVQNTLFTMSAAGWTITDDGDVDNDHTLILSTTNRVMEYTLWYGSTVTNGEAGIGTPKTITIPHYTGFHLILARPINGYVASLVCKENDNYITCVYQKSHP
jgi:hypothetical protein